jgi:hypothetical protein
MAAADDPSAVDLVHRAYAAFNARDLDAALAAMHPERLGDRRDLFSLVRKKTPANAGAR